VVSHCYNSLFIDKLLSQRTKATCLAVKGASDQEEQPDEQYLVEPLLSGLQRCEHLYYPGCTMKSKLNLKRGQVSSYSHI